MKLKKNPFSKDKISKLSAVSNPFSKQMDNKKKKKDKNAFMGMGK